MVLAMAEMYVQGVSTRKVTAIIWEVCDLEVTSTDVLHRIPWHVADGLRSSLPQKKRILVL